MPRSRTDPGAPGRCPRCRILAPHCICARVPVVPTDVEIVVLRHALESVRSTNTGRIAALALPRCRVVQVGGPGDPGHELVFDDAVLLFPEGVPLARPVRRLVVLDASWAQARRMAQRLPGVRALPRVSVGPLASPGPRLRAAPRPDQLSTLEAIACALAALEGDARAAPLLALHELHTRSVLRARGVHEGSQPGSPLGAGRDGPDGVSSPSPPPASTPGRTAHPRTGRRGW